MLLNIKIFVRTGCENICGIAPQCDDKNVIQKDNVGDKTVSYTHLRAHET